MGVGMVSDLLERKRLHLKVRVAFNLGEFLPMGRSHGTGVLENCLGMS